MTYDHWKTTDPADEWLGPDPEAEEEPEMGDRTYDDKCWSLAIQWLEGVPDLNSDANAVDLACAIQEAIEDWQQVAVLNLVKRVGDDALSQTLLDIARQGAKR